LDNNHGTDTQWIAEGYITISALRLDMNAPERNAQLQQRFT
jgi:hypothetical protein